jgi:hypothetical protein
MTDDEPFKPSDFALDTPSYSLSDLVKVTRLPVGTVRMWLERRILQLGPNDVDASGKGSTRHFTLRTVYFAATMAEISRLGVSPSHAARWAEIIWRDPLSGSLTPHEDMVFIGNPINNNAAHICRRSEITAEAIFHASSWPDEEADLSAVLVDASAVARRCREALGLPEQTGRF